MEIRSVLDEWGDRPKELKAAIAEASVAGQHKMLEIQIPQSLLDLSYPEFVERVEEVFPEADMEAWQKQHLENWLKMWDEMPIKPKKPVELIRTMFSSGDVKKDMERAMEAEKLAPKAHVMRYDSRGDKGGGVYCTCGAYKIHKRGKVLAAWGTKHTLKTTHRWARASDTKIAAEYLNGGKNAPVTDQ